MLLSPGGTGSASLAAQPRQRLLRGGNDVCLSPHVPEGQQTVLHDLLQVLILHVLEDAAGALAQLVGITVLDQGLHQRFDGRTSDGDEGVGRNPAHVLLLVAQGAGQTHDRGRFEVIGYSFGPPTHDAWRERLEKAFDHVLDVGSRSDREIAAMAREREIDIAIDLNGFTNNARTGIFALRPAPVQVNYLGYPGTLGADYYDYMIADSTVIPPEHVAYYNEKIAYLPHTFQVNNTTREISDRSFSRAELGLPVDSFVFCCFNHNYKITPDLFDIWMRLLRGVSASVLWLSGGNAAAGRNLRREAERRDISPDRLIFAPRVESLADHLARYRQADLFLDTFYYNAHTTASDALWAGLPVLTSLGNTFASRVAAGLLTAVGLPELVARSHAEYETLALELATQTGRLATIRRKLAENRSTQPLFDTELFTRNIENAYLLMQERHQAGIPPDHIIVEP